MRLSKYDKELIIEQILQDVPEVDYTAEAHKQIKDHFKVQLPADVKKMLSDPKLAQHVAKTQVYVRWTSNVYVLGGFSDGVGTLHLTGDILEAVERLRELDSAQCNARRALKQKLESAFAGINTRKRAAEYFPEFEKYLPSDDAAIRNLPIAVDVIPSLVQAGWPKGKSSTKPQPKK